MKHINTSLLMIISISLLFCGAAFADKQEVKDVVNLQGFNNSNISFGFKSTDAGDPVHSTSMGSSSSKNVTHDYQSIPKNIGHYLCLPSGMDYQISSSCQSLLSQGSSNGCKENTVSYPPCSSGAAVIEPDCNWRTVDDKSKTATWTWTIQYSSGGLYTVSCSESNYQGYQQ